MSGQILAKQGRASANLETDGRRSEGLVSRLSSSFRRICRTSKGKDKDEKFRRTVDEEDVADMSPESSIISGDSASQASTKEASSGKPSFEAILKIGDSSSSIDLNRDPEKCPSTMSAENGTENASRNRRSSVYNSSSFYGPGESEVRYSHTCGSFYGPQDIDLGSFYGPRDSNTGSFYGPRESDNGRFFVTHDSNCGSFYGSGEDPGEITGFCRNSEEKDMFTPEAHGAGSIAVIDQTENSWDAVYAANAAIRGGNFPSNFGRGSNDSSLQSWVTRTENDIPVNVVLSSSLYSQQGTNAINPISPLERRRTSTRSFGRREEQKKVNAGPETQNSRGCKSVELVREIKEHARQMRQSASAAEDNDGHKLAPSGFVDELTLEEEAQAIVAPATRMTITTSGIKYKNTARYATKDVHTANRAHAVNAQLARQAFNLPSVRDAEQAKLRTHLKGSIS